MAASYNLLREPWIRVMLHDGTNLRMGISKVFEHAGEIMAVTGDPHTRMVVLRLLAAIHARALTVAGHGDDIQHAQNLWDANRLDTDAAGTYLHEWEDRFDLFDPTHPFMQDPDLRVKIPKPARTLTPWDRDRGQFGPALDRRDTIPAADAAVGLLLDLAYDTPGIKSAPGSGRAYAPVTGVMCTGWPGSAITWTPDTGSLAHDLLAMTPMPYAMDDLPCWEHNPLDGEDLIVRPTGMIQSWTLPTRRIRLDVDGSGMVTAAHTTYGVIADPTAMYDADPLVCLNRKNGNPLYRADAERPLCWPPAWAAAGTRPHWFTWGAQLMGPRMVGVECSVTVYDQAVVEDMPSLRLTMQSRWLADTSGDLPLFLAAIRQMADAWVRLQRRFEIGTGRRLPETLAQRATPNEILRDQHTMADILRDLTPSIEQTLTDPADDALDTGIKRTMEYMRERGNEALEQHSALSFKLRYPAAEACAKFVAGIKNIAANWRTPHTGRTPQDRQTPHATPSAIPGRRGGKPKPVIRTGGGLPDQRFDSARQAVEWLRGNGHEKAATGAISRACNGKQASAYGYDWRFAD